MSLPVAAVLALGRAWGACAVYDSYHWGCCVFISAMTVEILNETVD